MRSLSTVDFIAFAHGLQWTLVLVLLSFFFGGLLGLVLALLRTSPLLPLRLFASLILQIVQGVPLLALLMFFYFGMPVFLGVEVPSLTAVTVAFSIYSGVFLGEIWRGGIEAVKYTQWEAAASLGLSRYEQFRFVIAPQALKISLPATVGFLVQLIKGTSLAAVVGFVELTRAGQIAAAATFQQLLIYSIVAAIYFAICFPLTTWSRSLEARLNGTG
ncbi:amino acid ABC transporter permease [Chelativorans sp. AA-79]|uniref:amino acid ABC transporter permease n=1 Tax=Chelativorans sp. AA-79 TaxID=3028735 RepID=UPI0023FA01A7|nr:amino acid ABC transporter permease [Chelativorans sp. AA-79]WEX10893.1 amino acid ABC transporter permease [Chelativorans sp. AA-79]